MISRVAERPNIFILHNPGQQRFAASGLDLTPKYEVVTPPTYDPHTFSQNLRGQAYDASLQQFADHNALIPKAVAAAQKLAGLLAERFAPKATLYPMPNLLATRFITLLTPLDPAKPELKAVAEAEQAAEDLTASLKDLSPHTVLKPETNQLMFTDDAGDTYELAVMREETEDERWLSEVYG